VDAKELYKFRAEELERNFQSLREIESRNVVEVFTGYAVLGIAYFQLQDRYPQSTLLGIGALLLTFSLFVIALYMTLRAKERLQFLRRMQGLYVKKLHEVCAVPELEPPADLKPPKHGDWWAFAAHIALSAIAMLALSAYIIGTTWRHL
jgi:hypothetical protein